MKIKELLKILEVMPPDAIVDIACDEEGNAFGPVSNRIERAILKTGEKVIILYPNSSELAEERYQD